MYQINLCRIDTSLIPPNNYSSIPPANSDARNRAVDCRRPRLRAFFVTRIAAPRVGVPRAACAGGTYRRRTRAGATARGGGSGGGSMLPRKALRPLATSSSRFDGVFDDEDKAGLGGDGGSSAVAAAFPLLLRGVALCRGPMMMARSHR